MTDYRSLEQKIRQLWIDEANRNTEIRRKVANVGRPTDNVKDETSKLAKQGEIKTKIIDEASDTDTDGAFMKDKDKTTNKKPDAQDEDDPREIKGGKTEVDLKPTTNDNTEDSTKEDETSKKARTKVNKEIGAKGVKEETMSGKLSLGSSEDQIKAIVEAMKKMRGVCPKCGKSPCQCEGDVKEAKIDEKLVGNQHKIDANKNNKIDAHDFKLLKQKKKMKEEVEELDEVSSKTLGNYMIKATKEVSKGTDKEDKRIGGSWMADQKIRKKEGYYSQAKVAAKEEVEFSAEELARIEEIAKGL